ncbi:class I SAM-dependent methyltransferase [Methylocystis parvus]|uniref:class I SAM-dependent methyltransferase n=1 Tax=Methylocystis parvus TaxID=134 RepID=UPI003C7726C3
MIPNGRALFKLQNDEQWLHLLSRSLHEPRIDGIELPRFPHPELQRRVVGSADAQALNEAFAFFTLVKGYAEALAMPVHAKTPVLDFGCGWGRFTRMFWGDVDSDALFGVDVEPETLAVCKGVGTPGSFSHIEPNGPLPYADQSFSLIVAYSVFSHLPQRLADYWMGELARVAKPGCVIAYTVEPRGFLDFILEIPSPPRNDWERGLAQFKTRVFDLFEDYDDGRFCYLPTSGGMRLTADIYGDSIVPESYIREAWGKYFRCHAYIDEPARFPQAVVIGQKP